MKQFQYILQRAIKEGAHAVELNPQKPARIINPLGVKDWNDTPAITAEYIASLFKVLFPHGVAPHGTKGQIDIPNFGLLQTIGVSGQKLCLKIYFPHAQNLFEQAWNQLQKKSSTSESPDLISSEGMPAPLAITNAPPPPPPPPARAPVNPMHASEQKIAVSQIQSNEPLTENLDDLTAPPADFTAPPADFTAPPADFTAPPADFTAPPADFTAPPADFTAPPADFTAPPADFTAPPADFTAPPEDLTEPPADLFAETGIAASPLNLSEASEGEDGTPLKLTQHNVNLTTPDDGVANPLPDFTAPVASLKEENPSQNPDGLSLDMFAVPDLAPAELEPVKSIPLAAESTAPVISNVDNQLLSTSIPKRKNKDEVQQPPHQTPSQPTSAPAMAIPPELLATLLQNAQGTAAKPASPKLKTTIESGPKEIDKFLQIMLDKKASDIHFTAGIPLALRIDGDIVRLPEHVLTEEQIRALFWPIASEFNQNMFDSDNDTDFAYEIKDVARFRVNLFRDRHGMGAVLRHIPSTILSFKQLGLPDVIRNFCYLNKGLVVVTGPTGSGKSTTLAAMVDHINEIRKDHILTLEDPVEFVHPQKNCLIRQREIHKHTNSFERALKAALREDPDIILIGEMRDLETTAMAIEIAETGHLVFGTLHTTTAISTIDRIIDQFPADQQEQIRTMLSESLKGVVAQTLLKKVGGGRCAAQEILVVNQAVSSLIREGKTHMLGNHMQSQRKAGNIMLNDALTERVAAGLVAPKEAWLKAIDKAGLIERFKNKGIDLSWFAATQSDEPTNKKAS